MSCALRGCFTKTIPGAGAAAVQTVGGQDKGIAPETDGNRDSHRTSDGRVNTSGRTLIAFALGDYCAGAATGALTAAAVRHAVTPEMDMVLAMLIGMAVGMVIHLVTTVVLGPLLGFFHTMVPASLIGMYGGMFFAMRDTMQMPPASFNQAVLVGAAFGAIVVAGVRLYDRALQGANGTRTGQRE